MSEKVNLQGKLKHWETNEEKEDFLVMVHDQPTISWYPMLFTTALEAKKWAMENLDTLSVYYGVEPDTISRIDIGAHTREEGEFIFVPYQGMGTVSLFITDPALHEESALEYCERIFGVSAGDGAYEDETLLEVEFVRPILHESIQKEEK